MNSVRIDVDLDARAVYIGVGAEPEIAETREVAPSVFTDLDGSGAVVGVEVLFPEGT